jgi:hypothetical protein
MRAAIWRTLLLTVAALSLAPSYAHVLEAPPRLVWSAVLWREATVFNGQFEFFAIVGAPIDVAAVILTSIFAFQHRRTSQVRGFALLAALAFAASLAAWAIHVAPVNSILATWSPGSLPTSFDRVRLRWESGHWVVAALKFVAFASLAIACVRRCDLGELPAPAISPDRRVH